MNKQRVQAFLFFLLVAIFIFYIANSSAREAPSFESESTESSLFLALIERLDTVSFDLEFINSLTNTSVVSTPVAQVRQPSSVGRGNPFSNIFSKPSFQELPRQPVEPIPARPEIPPSENIEPITEESVVEEAPSPPPSPPPSVRITR